MLEVSAMGSFQKFWSKPRNRGLVYCLALIFIFRSYVVGFPETSEKSKKIDSSLRQSKIHSTPLEDVVSPSSTSSEEARIQLSESPNITASSSAALSSSPNGYPPPDFLLSDRNYSDAEKAAIYKELLRNEPVEYPYEFDQELFDLSEKVKNKRANKKDLDRYLKLATQEPKLKEKFAKDEAQKAALNRNRSSSNPWVSLAKNSDENSMDALDPSANQAFASGTSQTFQTLKYAPKPHDPIPQSLNKTHDNLKIYSVRAGTHASAMMVRLGYITSASKIIYQSIDPSVEQSLHEKYRIGPDFDYHFEFEGSFQEQINKAAQAADLLLFVLGTHGQITFEITNGVLKDQDGADLVIWSNPFCAVMDPNATDEIKKELRKYYDEFIPFSSSTKNVIDQHIGCYEELAKVEVSSEGPKGEFRSIEPCAISGDKRASQCSGYGLNLWNQNQNPYDSRSGGDRYDLGQHNMDDINAIRITDLANPTIVDQLKMQANIAENGYDLDAIAMLHFQTHTK